MNFGISDLVDELKVLRRGYGVEEPAMPAKLGHAVRTVCGVAHDDSAAAVRHKVRNALTELTERLPCDLGAMARTALGLDGTATVRYEERLERLAEEMDRNPRTARRRIDGVLERLAELALDSVPRRTCIACQVPWHTVRLQVAMLLTGPSAEVFETRRIVAHEPGLAEIGHSVTIVRPPRWTGSISPLDLGIDVLRGAALGTPVPQGPRSLGLPLQLPRPLDEGEEHEFSFRIRLKQPFEPYYVCTPRYPCERFDLTIRFAPDRLPKQMWLLDNELPLAVADPWPHRKPLRVDQVGEVRVEFRDLEPNRSSGIGWEPLAQ